MFSHFLLFRILLKAQILYKCRDPTVRRDFTLSLAWHSYFDLGIKQEKKFIFSLKSEIYDERLWISHLWHGLIRIKNQEGLHNLGRSEKGSLIWVMTQPYFHLPIGLLLWFAVSMSLIWGILTQAQYVPNHAHLFHTCHSFCFPSLDRHATIQSSLQLQKPRAQPWPSYALPYTCSRFTKFSVIPPDFTRMPYSPSPPPLASILAQIHDIYISQHLTFLPVLVNFSRSHRASSLDHWVQLQPYSLPLLPILWMTGIPYISYFFMYLKF